VAARELPKPGMGVEEGMVIVGNEMALVATLAAARVGQGTGETA
jgi:methylaspartate ammonia-lyase